MKKHRILKIMGVALTLAMVFSLGIALMATPVAADPDEWTTYDLPDAGEDGDYFWDATIDAGPGPIDRDIDGYFWAYVSIGAAEEVVKSLDTEGRAWEVTMYSDADDGVVGGAVVAIACSSIDEDIVYVADADEVYKTEDGGDTWEQVGSSADFNTEPISCLDVGYVDDEPYVYIGTVEGTPSGDVYYINDVAFGGAWTDLNVIADADDDGTQDADEDEISDVYGLACSPDFDNDALVAAVTLTNGLGGGDIGSFVVVNRGADIGEWTDVEIGIDLTITESSDPVFPEDFDEDDAYEFFVGTCDATAGLMYRVYGETDASIEELDDVDVDIISLDLAGDVGDTYLVAGAEDAADIWYSDDDGDNWLQATDEGIGPAGADTTYVIADADVADNGMVWSATAGADAGVNLSLDGGESSVGIGLLDDAAASVDDLAISPEWASDDTLFALLNVGASTEVLRYDGTNWERVFEETQYGAAQDIELVDCSPEFGDDETIFIADVTTPAIYFSENGGTLWEETREPPTNIASWAIVDSETVMVGGTDGNIYLTDIQGRRVWDDYEADAGADDLVSLAISGDTVIAGNNVSEVFMSEDFGETWDEVGDLEDETTANQAAYVGFDTDDPSVIYAASDDVIARYLDIGDLTLDWELFTPEGAPTAISGLVTADGCVYVSDGVDADSDPDADAGTDDQVGAVQRTVDPLDDVDDVDETEFDYMAEGLTADGVAANLESFDFLYLGEGSTVLWAVDTAGATIWTIEDVLAVAATGGEADPDVDSAALTWDGFDNATDYDVAVYSDEAMGLAYEWLDAVTGDDDPVLNVTDGNTTGINADNALDAGTEYWWQVRATEPVNSKWSDVWTFTTLPATMTIDADQFGPAIGATDVPITPSFGWEDIEEADEYMFELADNPDFTTPIVSTTTTNPVFQLDAALDYETNYFWRVKAISGTGQSRWATGTFTTMAEAVVAPAPPPPAEAPEITIPPTQKIASKWIYAVIGVGATLATVVIVLIVRTRKV